MEPMLSEIHRVEPMLSASRPKRRPSADGSVDTAPPWADERAARTDNHAVPVKEVNRMAYKVLVVDDSKLARMSIARLLGSLRPDWTRVEAANATEAIELRSTQTIDLALLDFNMPGPDGLSLATELRSRYPDMPMAIISANHQDEIVSRAHAIGAAFLSKPLTEAVLGDYLATLDGAPAAAE
jgi:CheY-like chemotaxis protein